MCFHPLAGKRFEKVLFGDQNSDEDADDGFHPLAGKRFEKVENIETQAKQRIVSIPLRGKGLRKVVCKGVFNDS